MKKQIKEWEMMTAFSIWLIKTLCIDTNATIANIEQDIIYEGKNLGRYKITIKKLDNKVKK